VTARARTAAAVAVVLAAGGLLAACGTGNGEELVPGGSADRGRELISSYGCGACHVIGGIQTARGHVGPPLTNFRAKGSIAGVLPNTPPNVERWIQHPQQVHPGTIMPNLGVTPRNATDIAAYLYGQ
jgi:cytochrome c